MSYTHPQNQFVTRFILPQNMDGLRVLDCACGRGAWGFFIRSQLKGSAYLEGFDLFSPYIERLRELKLYNYVYRMDIREVRSLAQKFDVILAMDVLEHLEKYEAMKVMRDLEDMTKIVLIISLPIGAQKQDVGHDGNLYQIHKSSFRPEEMEGLGYETKLHAKFTRSLRFVERIRCFLFGLEFKEGRFVAWKRFDARALGYIE